MKRLIRTIIYNTFLLICLLFLVLFLSLRKKKNSSKNKIIFGTTPILNYKYWSQALKELDYNTQTLMSGFYSINKKEDYDLYFEDLIPKFIKTRRLKKYWYPLFVWLYVAQNAKIVVTSFNGLALDNSIFWRIEPLLFKMTNTKSIVIPYGSDAYMYSKIKDPSLQNSLLISYPDAAKKEKLIEKKVRNWEKHADIILAGFSLPDGLSRWDAFCQMLCINTDEWKSKTIYSQANGYNSSVKILHCPNHRGYKGTEFLIHSINQLKAEGVKVELVLLEKVQNNRVKEVMQEIDILAEQFIATCYGLNGIEGMASGLPVMANLENEVYTKIFRRYSFLNECPIFSTSPENLKENLKILITNPELRKELGVAGRAYVEKYHSFKATQYLFSSIFKKLDGEDIDLINLYHPLKSNYAIRNKVIHPLSENKLGNYNKYIS